jgi:hypothetical protein
MHHDRVRRGRDAADRGEILARIVAEIRVEARRDAERPAVAEADRVAVGGAPRHRPRAGRATGSGTVVDHHLLAEQLAQLLGDDAHHDVGAAARRERNDQRERADRIFVRRGRARDTQKDQRRSRDDATQTVDPHGAVLPSPHSGAV